ncbi:MAG: cell division protein SepF [Ruminiclostridium sp.]|nr:cell division protein SepF [Ruminiclostridium sp.]
MGFMDSFKKLTGMNNDDNMDNEGDYSNEMPSALNFDDYDETPRTTTIKSSKMMSIPATTHLQVIVVKPEKYADAAAIADHFKNKKTVVLNLDKTNKEVANRLIDFLGGVAYAADGDLKRISGTTYIIVPVNVDISGDIIEDLGNVEDF